MSSVLEAQSMSFNADLQPSAAKCSPCAVFCTQIGVGSRKNQDGVKMAIGGAAPAVAKLTRSSSSESIQIDWSGIRADRVSYESGATIFRQGEPATTIIYIDKGSVRLSVVSHAGKEAVIAVLDRDDFVGEACLAGQSIRTATATAMSECSVMRIRRQEIIRKLHNEESFADSFMSHILKRIIRMEEDLIDQLFNSTEKRLARTLLLLAQYGKKDGPRRALPKVSQEILAEMVGTTRTRVNFFMNKFRKLGFVEYNATCLKVNNSLLGVVLAD
jgi:CRP-like cAMP-binding protein